MKVHMAITVLMLLTALGCKDTSSEQSVPLIGLDEEARATIKHLPQRKFLKKVGPLFSSITNTAIEKLDQELMGDWEMKRVTVGLQLSAAITLTTNIKTEAKPAIEFHFERLP